MGIDTMTSSERAAWTRFVEERQRQEQQQAEPVRRGRSRRKARLSREEMEAELDDLVREAEQRRLI
jgi:hypothetical protein